LKYLKGLLSDLFIVKDFSQKGLAEVKIFNRQFYRCLPATATSDPNCAVAFVRQKIEMIGDYRVYFRISNLVVVLLLQF